MVASANPRRAKLQQVQADLARRRASAFIDYAPVVCGHVLRPITFHSLNALLAFENAFVTGEPVTFTDLVNFVWLHHPDFGQPTDPATRRAKRRLTRSLWRALHPRFPQLNAFLHFWTPILSHSGRLARTVAWFTRRLRVPTEEQRTSATAAQIRHLVKEATFDLPPGDDKAEPIPFASRAHHVALFHRHLGLSLSEAQAFVAATPMKQVVEHYREALHHLSRGQAMLMPPEEAAIWAEDLDAKTVAAQQAARAA